MTKILLEINDTCSYPHIGSLVQDCSIHCHYIDVIIGAIASQITSLTIVYSTVYSGADQSKHQSSASLAFVWGFHRGPVNSPTQMASNAENVSIWWRHHANATEILQSGTNPSRSLSDLQLYWRTRIYRFYGSIECRSYSILYVCTGSRAIESSTSMHNMHIRVCSISE